MCEMGATFTLMSDKVAKLFGLQVRPYHASFSMANGSTTRICGEVDCTLQVHDRL